MAVHLHLIGRVIWESKRCLCRLIFAILLWVLVECNFIKNTRARRFVVILNYFYEFLTYWLKFRRAHSTLLSGAPFCYRLSSLTSDFRTLVSSFMDVTFDAKLRHKFCKILLTFEDAFDSVPQLLLEILFLKVG